MDDAGEDMDGEMRGPLPDKLHNITFQGLYLKSLPTDIFMVGIALWLHRLEWGGAQGHVSMVNLHSSLSSPALHFPGLV